MSLTKEQEEAIDFIIEKYCNHPCKTWEYNGEDSEQVDDVESSLRSAAIEIKEYLKNTTIK